MQTQKLLYDPDLQAALDELAGATEEAREEGILLPSKLALDNAEKLLLDLYHFSPQLYSICPTEDGEITIHAVGGYNRSVYLICEPDGGVLCSVNINGQYRSRRYLDATTLLDEFVQTAIADLVA